MADEMRSHLSFDIFDGQTIQPNQVIFQVPSRGSSLEINCQNLSKGKFVQKCSPKKASKLAFGQMYEYVIPLTGSNTADGQNPVPVDLVHITLN